MANLPYGKAMLSSLRFKLCPMCGTQLARKTESDGGIPRAMCPDCGWTHYPTNAIGVNIVAETEEGIVAILPPDAPTEFPAALPGGHVEYGESPEGAAIREAKEETGLDVELVRCLGWYFEFQEAYPGPIVSFVFLARSVGGFLKGSKEGRAAAFPPESFPAIAPERGGSRKAMELYLKQIHA